MNVMVSIAAEIAHVIHTIHVCGYLHRDISCSNVLLTSDFSVRVIDFGVSHKGISANNTAGAVAYMSLEVMNADAYGPDCDWWSYGVLMCAMLQGKTPISAHVDATNVEYHQLPKHKK